MHLYWQCSITAANCIHLYINCCISANCNGKNVCGVLSHPHQTPPTQPDSSPQLRIIEQQFLTRLYVSRGIIIIHAWSPFLVIVRGRSPALIVRIHQRLWIPSIHVKYLLHPPLLEPLHEIALPPPCFVIFENPHIVCGSVLHQRLLPYEFCGVDSSTLRAGISRQHKGDAYGFCGGRFIWNGDCVHFGLVFGAKFFELSHHRG